MRIVPAASVAAFVLVFTIPVLATTQTGPLKVTVTTSPNPYAIEGTTSVNKSAGILAESTGTGDSALEGFAEGQDSAGLEGFAQSSSGTVSNGVFGFAENGYGVYGQTESASGAGVFGQNLATNGGNGYGAGVLGKATNNIGVVGVGTSGGIGVFGQSDTSAGMYGVTDDTTGTGSLFPDTNGSSAGVLGVDQTTSSNVAGNSGVAGQTAYGAGVLGYATNSGYGMYAASTTGTAIKATSGNEGIEALTTDTGTIGGIAGVFGVDASSNSSLTNDIGVHGLSVYGQGVYGLSGSHQGVFGDSGSDTGVAAISMSGSGLIAESSGSAAAVGIFAYNGGDIIDAAGLPSGASSPKNVMSVDGSGNMILAGGLTQHGTPNSTVRDANGGERVAYSQRATQATIEDFGRAQMTGGRAVVRLDPTFASTLADGDYLVFLTAGGRSNGLYVANRSLAGFEIRENEGASTLEIDYRIVGRPRAERPEPRLALLAPRPDSPATQHLVRAADDIARIAASHRASDAKVLARETQLAKTMHAHPFTLSKRLRALANAPAGPRIPSVRPDEYGPRLPH